MLFWCFLFNCKRSSTEYSQKKNEEDKKYSLEVFLFFYLGPNKREKNPWSFLFFSATEKCTDTVGCTVYKIMPSAKY